MQKSHFQNTRSISDISSLINSKNQKKYVSKSNISLKINDNIHIAVIREKFCLIVRGRIYDVFICQNWAEAFVLTQNHIIIVQDGFISSHFFMQLHYQLQHGQKFAFATSDGIFVTQNGKIFKLDQNRQVVKEYKNAFQSYTFFSYQDNIVAFNVDKLYKIAVTDDITSEMIFQGCCQMFQDGGVIHFRSNNNSFVLNIVNYTICQDDNFQHAFDEIIVQNQSINYNTIMKNETIRCIIENNMNKYEEKVTRSEDWSFIREYGEFLLYHNHNDLFFCTKSGLVASSFLLPAINDVDDQQQQQLSLIAFKLDDQFYQYCAGGVEIIRQEFLNIEPLNTEVLAQKRNGQILNLYEYCGNIVILFGNDSYSSLCNKNSIIIQFNELVDVKDTGLGAQLVLTKEQGFVIDMTNYQYVEVERNRIAKLFSSNKSAQFLLSNVLGADFQERISKLADTIMILAYRHSLHKYNYLGIDNPVKLYEIITFMDQSFCNKKYRVLQ